MGRYEEIKDKVRQRIDMEDVYSVVWKGHFEWVRENLKQGDTFSIAYALWLLDSHERLAA